MTSRIIALLLAVSFIACAGSSSHPDKIAAAPAAPADDRALLDDVEHRSFNFFWDLADPQTLLIPDRAPTPSFSSIAAVGFGLTAYGIGAERGYVTRAEAA